MARILIIGIGNNLRSDDGVGWHVAQELSGQLSASDVNVIATQQLMPEIAETISRAEVVLFVDATHAGEPGGVRGQRVAPANGSRRDSHHLSPSGVLRLAEEIYQRYPQAFLLTVTGESFAMGERLSQAVSDALPAVRREIERFVFAARSGESAGLEVFSEKISG